MNGLTILGIIAALVVLDFMGGWWFGRKINNYSLVDAMWAFWIGLAGVIYSTFGTGDFEKRVASRVPLKRRTRLGASRRVKPILEGDSVASRGKHVADIQVDETVVVVVSPTRRHTCRDILDPQLLCDVDKMS